MIINFLVQFLTDFVSNHLRFCLSLVTVILTAYYHWKRRKLYLMAYKFHGPPSLPIVGNGFLFAGRPEKFLSNVVELGAKYECPFRFWLAHKLFIVISRPEDLEIVFNSPHALEKAALYKFLRYFGGGGLITAKASRWKRTRKIVAPAFNQRILNTFIPIFLEQSKILVARLEKFVDSGVFNVSPLVFRFTMDTICESAMGIQMNSQSGKEEYHEYIARASEICWWAMCHFWILPDVIWHRTRNFKESQQLLSKMNEVARQIINTKRAEYKEHKPRTLGEKSDGAPVKRKAFLEHLIEISENGVAFTDEDILDEVNTFLSAGTDTTAAIIGFTFIMLGMHPQVQDRIFEEVNAIFDGTESPITFENLTKMKYLERVLKETMRLYPVTPLLTRSITEDIPLDTRTLPKGSECVLAAIFTHRDPKYWPNPLQFNPDRFLPEEVSKRHPYSYFPFSAGPRNCIGISYAMMSMKIAVSTVVRSYKISTDYKEVADVDFTQEIVIKATNGSRIELKRRLN